MKPTIIESSMCNADLSLLCHLMRLLQIQYEWQIFTDQDSSDNTFIRGYDEIYFLKVYHPAHILLATVNRYCKLKAFL